MHHRPLVHALAAAVLAAAPLPAALAFGDVGGLAPCASFTTCSAALGSTAAWQVRYEVSHITTGFVMPPDLAPGVTVYQGADASSSGAVASANNGAQSLPVATGEFYRGAAARAQSGFGVNRAETSQSRGVGGTATRGSGTATVVLHTFGQAESGWRDVWRFSAAGHLSGVLQLDGASRLGTVGSFQPSYDHQPLAAWGDWFFELRVWDVTNLSVSDDFELGGPTPVARARLTGHDEQRASFNDSVALEFDFVSGVDYVVTAELRATSFDGREFDLFNTARLGPLQLGGGAQLAALSGHDYVSAVPEPGAWVLWLAGLGVLGRIMRTHAAALHQDARRGQRLRRARRHARAARAFA